MFCDPSHELGGTGCGAVNGDFHRGRLFLCLPLPDLVERRTPTTTTCYSVFCHGENDLSLWPVGRS